MKNIKQKLYYLINYKIKNSKLVITYRTMYKKSINDKMVNYVFNH